ncbi:MAG TPA: VOC family protein [Stellaceae bacterium]|jgi:catechol 2,3-dioxygenase|nr:VOC family protein [Stellaceae bacterium]
MSSGKVTAVRSITLGVSDLAASKAFYTGIWGLTPALERADAVFLRGTGPYHHVLALTQHVTPQVLEIDLLADDRAAIDALHRQVSDSAATQLTAPGRHDAPGGGYGFSFVDPDGRRVNILTDDIRHADTTPHPDKPAKITHVVLNSPDMTKISTFYAERLGFEAKTYNPRMFFMKCNQDHHSLAFANGNVSTLNHLAFAMQDVDAVSRGAKRMMTNGYPMGWGVGQHAAGEDVYAYFEGPEGGGIEYITKVPDGWLGSADNTENWDVALRPTEKQAAAMRRIPFTFAS